MITPKVETKTLKEIVETSPYNTELKNNGLLFGKIGTDGTFTWLTNAQGKLLDKMYFLQHSSYKQVYLFTDDSQSITICNTTTLCGSDTIVGYHLSTMDLLKDEVVLKFKDKWNKLYATYTTTLNALENDNYTITDTPNLTTTNQASADTYGFNSSTEVHQGKGASSSSQTGTRTMTYKGVRDGDIPELMRKQIETLQWNFYEQLMNDVDTIITLPKYVY